MPINKPAAISAALILAISSAVQAQTDFNFNRIPAAERQRMLQEAVAEINGRTAIYQLRRLKPIKSRIY